ncbi:MAG: hypothetical protein ACRDHK_08285 [Actinomycetota bacterium]
MDKTAAAATAGVAQVYDLHALRAFAAERRVRKMLFRTDQLWSEAPATSRGSPRRSKTLALHEMIFYVRRDRALRAKLPGLGGQGRWPG